MDALTLFWTVHSATSFESCIVLPQKTNKTEITALWRRPFTTVHTFKAVGQIAYDSVWCTGARVTAVPSGKTFSDVVKTSVIFTSLYKFINKEIAKESYSLFSCRNLYHWLWIVYLLFKLFIYGNLHRKLMLSFIL